MQTELEHQYPLNKFKETCYHPKLVICFLLKNGIVIPDNCCSLPSFDEIMTILKYPLSRMRLYQEIWFILLDIRYMRYDTVLK